MVEVIYTFKQGRYPFSRGKQSPNTYMQFLLQAKDEQDIQRYRQISQVVKKLRHPNLMHLERVLKEDMTFHMLYQFQDKSIEQRLNELEDGEGLVELFVELEDVFETLIANGLKAQIYLEYMAVDEHNRLKVWLKPDQIELLRLQQTPNLSKIIKKQLSDFYQTQGTRIHLQIEQVFQTSPNHLSSYKKTTKQQQQKETQLSKSKTPNFVIEGNTLKFIHTPGKCGRGENSQGQQMLHHMNKANHLVYEQSMSGRKEDNMISKHVVHQQQHQVDISKMSVAQKVLYYKKLKQLQQQTSLPLSNSQQGNKIIIKDSSNTMASHQDLSKSSNSDSNMQIKTEVINRNKLKIITSQEIEVEGDSDDDLEKLAREKIAKINIEREKKDKSPHDSSTEYYNKSNGSGYSDRVQKYLKTFEDNSRQDSKGEQTKQINSKIAQAKLKAKNILQKYCTKQMK